MSIDAYGRVIPIEDGGFEERKRCMQQKRCIISMSHATSPSEVIWFNKTCLMYDEFIAAAFTPLCYAQHRNHATLPLHATLIFSPAIGKYATHPTLSFRYTVTIWNK
jgi:hypothetical protein